MVLQRGEHGSFQWLVSSEPLPSLVEVAVRYHTGLRLCITSFDSGPISPTPEELNAGWTKSANIMVSPPLADGLEVPHDQYDEWYIFDHPPPVELSPDIFVNHCGFSIVPPDEIWKADDLKSDRHALDWLILIQERFWEQMRRVDPISYIAMGDNDVVVSKRREFIEELIRP